jgi:hypothetical protein
MFNKFNLRRRRRRHSTSLVTRFTCVTGWLNTQHARMFQSRAQSSNNFLGHLIHLQLRYWKSTFKEHMAYE